jgi:amino acid permease
MVGCNNSFKTILSTTNTMIGSTTLIVPVIFAKVGIITCLISLVFLSIVNFITANILLKHG